MIPAGPADLNLIPNSINDPAVTHALELVGIIRDYGPDMISDYLRREEKRLNRIVVALAAMVPDDKTAAELLAWIDPEQMKRNARTRAREERRRRAAERAGAPVPKPTPLPCGSHAAFNRHKAKGEQPCELCQAGERIYQAAANRRRRDRGRAA